MGGLSKMRTFWGLLATIYLTFLLGLGYYKEGVVRCFSLFCYSVERREVDSLFFWKLRADAPSVFYY